MKNKVLFVGILLFLVTSFSFYLLDKKSFFIKHLSSDIRKQIAKESKKIINIYPFGNNFIYVQAIGDDCVSCHQTYIYIFNKYNSMVFFTTSADNYFGSSSGNSFSIIQPINNQSDKIGYKLRSFDWNGKTFIEQ